MIGVLLLAGAVVAVLVLQGVERTQRGTGAGKVKPPPGTKVVSVKRTSAQDFDPLGDKDEHADEARLAVDKDPGTAWTTESYSGNTIAGKAGVGLYIDAAPGVAATQIEIDTPEDRLAGRDPRRPQRRRAHRPPPARANDWQKVGGGTVRRSQQRFTLRTDGKQYRYYLVWITKLPPGQERVEISDVSLFRRSSAA